MPEIANFLPSKCVEQDPRCDYAESWMPSAEWVAAEALENLHIWFAVDSQVKFCVSFPPLLCYAVCLLGCLSPSFSILFAAFATHYEYWTEQFVNTIANKNATIERNQPFLYTKAKWNALLLSRLHTMSLAKCARDCCGILSSDTIYIMMIICNTQAQHVE